MKKKILILIFLILSIIFLLLWNFYIQPFFKAVKEDCKENKIWKIENYKIIEKKCLGLAGPHFYPIYLYEQNEQISQGIYLKGSQCLIEFKIELNKKILFDKCNCKFK